MRGFVPLGLDRRHHGRGYSQRVVGGLRGRAMQWRVLSRLRVGRGLGFGVFWQAVSHVSENCFAECVGLVDLQAPMAEATLGLRVAVGITVMALADGSTL